MEYHRYRREGPGGLDPIEYAKEPEEMRLLTDEERERQDAIRRAVAQNAKNPGDASMASAAFEGALETPEEIARRIDTETTDDLRTRRIADAVRRIDSDPNALPAQKEWLARVRRGERDEFGDMRMLDELEELQVVKEANEREYAEQALAEMAAAAGAGDLTLMNERQMQDSQVLEALLRGELIPTETVEVEAPVALHGDPEFALSDSGPRLMTAEDEARSIANERAIEAERQRALAEERARKQSDTEEIVLDSAPGYSTEELEEDARVESREEPAIAMSPNAKELERRRWSEVLGNRNAVDRKSRERAAVAEERDRWNAVLGKKEDPDASNERIVAELEEWAKTEPGVSNGSDIETIDADVMAERAEWERKLGTPSKRRERASETPKERGILSRIRSWFGR